MFYMIVNMGFALTVRGAANDWVKSYLSCRKQFIQVDEHSSKLLDIVCGVQQGSVLGPKLLS